jgi:hypothetical protein
MTENTPCFSSLFKAKGDCESDGPFGKLPFSVSPLEVTANHERSRPSYVARIYRSRLLARSLAQRSALKGLDVRLLGGSLVSLHFLDVKLA